jgi:fibronectin-binding autotransporter adhesin
MQVVVVGSGGRLRLDALTVADGFASVGGGIVNNAGGTLAVFNSTFSGNKAQQTGGAIGNFGTATVVNSTFAGNLAGERGGAIANSGFGNNITLINCTIAGNNIPLGGAIATEEQGTVTLRNTLLATNSGDNCLVLDNSNIADGGGNLDDATSCGFTDNTSLSNASAGLDPGGLHDNGGPTQTIALLPGSHAIDRGIEAVCADATTVKGRDQRGEPRPSDGDGDGASLCDIGALEHTPVICRGRAATITVYGNTIVGDPDNGKPYTGTLRGTSGDDVIVGTRGNDLIYGAEGKDIICGRRGSDTLRGGPGRDQLSGQRGRDRLFGGLGRDLCNGGKGIDEARGCEQLESVP